MVEFKVLQRTTICASLDMMKHFTKMKKKNKQKIKLYQWNIFAFWIVWVLLIIISIFFVLLRLNRHSRFRHLAYRYWNFCIWKHQCKAGLLLNTHILGCISSIKIPPIPTIQILVFDVENKHPVVVSKWLY